MSLLLLFHGVTIVSEDMSATTPTGLSGVMVANSVVYTAQADWLADSTGRSVRVKIVWYDGSGSVISTTTGSSVTDNTSTWTTATASATSPATATYASITLEVLSTNSGGEVHYADKIGLFRGTNPIWVPHP